MVAVVLTGVVSSLGREMRWDMARVFLIDAGPLEP